MGRDFWRTIQIAIERDNWTARLVVILCATAVTALGAYTIAAAR
jgi:hypothetical protein